MNPIIRVENLGKQYRLGARRVGALPPRGAFVCRIPRLPLPPSAYRITYSLMRDGEYLDAMEDAYELNVTDGDFYGSGEVPPATHGCCLVDARWRLEAEMSHDEEPEGAGSGARQSAAGGRP